MTHVPGAGTPTSLDSASDSAYDVQIQNPSAGLPAQCACCMAPAECSMTISRAQKYGRTTVTRKLQVPYCTRCRTHVSALRNRGITLGVVATLIGLCVPLAIIASWDYAPGALLFALAPLVALVALLGLGAFWKEPPVATAQGCCTNHVALVLRGFERKGPAVDLRAYNPYFAQQVSAMHGVPPRLVPTKAPRSSRWVVAPLLALLGAIPTYLLTHSQAYFDNPSTAPLVFVLDDDDNEVAVPPGGHASDWIPIGTRQFEVQMNGQPVDRFNGDVGPTGKYVATTMRAACYARTAASYGSESLGSGDRSQFFKGQPFYTLGAVDYVFEPFPHSVSVSHGQGGARRTRFVRVDCVSGQPFL